MTAHGFDYSIESYEIFGNKRRRFSDPINSRKYNHMFPTSMTSYKLVIIKQTISPV